ncbi:MAG: damage-inducible protein CinA, partial [Planctomycetales bacterium]|nr:damage-inducible protein CinA [Planctomycetales bacterium]
GDEVLYHTTVGDDLRANLSVFASANERADVVVATGGLGPTADDLTREALAAAAGVELERDEASLERIRQMFADRGRRMPQRNELQAMFPRGATAIRNEHGTAPGVRMAVPREGRPPCQVFALPGVPAEMMPMFEETVAPAIAKLHQRPRVIRHRRLKCFGVGESRLEEMLPGMFDRGREPRVGITVSKATITLRITATGETDQACLDAIRPIEELARHTLGDLVFGEEDEELQHVVVRELVERSLTLVVADHASHGLLPGWLSVADQAGLAFQFGQVGPARPLDEQAAVALAVDLRSAQQTEVALVLAPATVTHGVESVVVALVTADASETRVFPNLGHPDIEHARAAKLALNQLRLHLLEADEP